MTPGDRPSIPLETEPVEWLHPGLVGRVDPGNVQPVQRVPALEEEPVLWLSLDAARRVPRPRERSSDRADPVAGGRPSPPMPATGTPSAWAAGAFLAVLGWMLRRRRRST